MRAGGNGIDLFGWMPDKWRLLPEYEVFGFYFTSIFFIIFGAVLLGAFSAWIGGKLRLERFVWHPPLFLIALVFVYGFTLALMFLPR